MAEEVEKKYRVPAARREQILAKLVEVGAEFEAADFEENVLFRGGVLSLKQSILRLRRTRRQAVLTYKEALPSSGNIKRRLEHETEIADAKALEAILENLGFQKWLVYEKRRETWQLGGVEVVLDELPFGLFLEIEGAENQILAAEIELEITDLEFEPSPYPALAALHGAPKQSIIEARFPPSV
jgi:adenylate cyclase class 2